MERGPCGQRGLGGVMMDKPRIFLGSSGKQQKLLQALTRGLEDVAHVEPWATSFNPGTTALERLLQKVDRDTERFAMKSSAQEQDGQWVKVRKNPLDKSKASLAGRLQVVNLTGHDEIVPEEQWADPEDPRVRLKPVFENGVILRQHTFEQVRARARVDSDSQQWSQRRAFGEASAV